MDASGRNNNLFYDAFISYGRADSKQFAISLYQRLLKQGYSVWFDQNDIPLGVDFQAQIEDGLEKTNNFLFIISPHAVNSPYCAREISMALKRNKRIIPLLHVEEISRGTWQTRNPQGTDAEWATFQAEGLHSSFITLHPDIAKINWVYFREGVEDFEDSFINLIGVFDRHREYVQQHTYFLMQALEWERHQQQSPYLLTGEERQSAEDWLKLRFQNEQPPCLPTDLHCEYITESIKNANNLMTQVFLSHADEDRVISDKIRYSLMREGFTVWTNRTDIHTGEAFQDAIERGIEEADNIVYLLSPNSLRSFYCQHEIEYALSLNKRIIPILIDMVELYEIPPALGGLQYIDFTDNLIQADHHKDENQLIRTLRENASYFEQHKLLLARAIKWKRDNRNPSLLLRGYNLRHAETWLEGAKSTAQYLPTTLQKEYIQASLEQPQDQALDVFIAYSRVNSDFARRLNDALQSQGKTTWFDQESIASGTDFQQEIYRGIESANNFLFLLSPSSVSSPYCADEVEYAQKLNKRIVTVLHQPVDKASLHPALAGVQWIDFNRPNRDFFTNVGELNRTLDTDEEYVRSHTRLTGRALEWERSGQDPSFLLRGSNLVASEQWLQQAAGKTPSLTDLHIRYIQSSRKAPLRQAKPRAIALSSLAATVVVLILKGIGAFQFLELKTFDLLMQMRRSEPPDSRFLIVEITEDDMQRMVQRREKGGTATLSDESLERLLEKLDRFQPSVVGLDVFRDYDVNPAFPRLMERFQQDRRLFGVCKLPHVEQGRQVQIGSDPPPTMPLSRVGFADTIRDPDGAIRQQTIRLVPPPDVPCQAPESFAFLVARRYLEQKQGTQFVYKDPVKSNGVLQLGHVTFRRLKNLDGGYGNFDQFGFQILVNYRAPEGDPGKLAERVSLGEFLSDRVDPGKQTEWKNRIVLIGSSSELTSRDYVRTPYGREIPGVVYQAQVASQILSSVLDGRHLLRALDHNVVPLWYALWAMIGGFLVYRLRSPLALGLALAAAGVTIIVICVISFMVVNLWLPLVSPLLALLLSAGGSLYITNQFRASKKIGRHHP